MNFKTKFWPNRSEKYDMGLWSVIALGIGSVVGAGIFALLGQVIMSAGYWTYGAFAVAGTAALFSGYSYGELAARYPDAGGLTDYFRRAFSCKCVSGTLSLIYMLTSAVSISMMAKSFGIYFTALLKGTDYSWMTVNEFAAVLIVGLALLNMMSAGDVGRAEILLVTLKILILGSLIGAAMWNADLTLSNVLPQPTLMSFWGAIGVTFFAYAGYGVITNAAADVQHPKRTIRLGIYITILAVMALYMALAHVVLNFIPAADLEKNADTAVAVAADKLLGKWGYGLIYVAAVMAFVSGINATFFSIFRISRSLAEQGVLPKIYEKKFWKRGTYGNILTSAIVLLAAIFMDFSSIVNLSSGAYLVSYLGIFAANWHLRRETGSSKILILVGFGLMLFILTAFIVSIAVG